MPDLGLSWERPDLAGIAAGFGIKAWTANDVDEMRDACRAAATHDGPTLIDARVGSGGYFDQLKALRG